MKNWKGSISVLTENKLFNNQAICNFEPKGVSTDELKKTETLTWIGKQVPVLVSIPSNLIDEPIFLYNNDPQTNLIIDVVSNLELLAEKKINWR